MGYCINYPHVCARASVFKCSALPVQSYSKPLERGGTCLTRLIDILRYQFILLPFKASCEWSQTLLSRTDPSVFIIRLRHIPFGLSVKLRQFDGGLSVEPAHDLITVTISI